MAAPYGVIAQVLSKAFGPLLQIERLPPYDRSDSLFLLPVSNSSPTMHEGAAKLLRLVWTNIMASSTVGINLRWRTGASEKTSNSAGIVEMYAKELSYDLRYAIPANLPLVGSHFGWYRSPSDSSTKLLPPIQSSS
ncbi:hypothetical protein D8B26_000309 [Coccidioides posadasii str. Silveira]|uniref:Uncharacterized protein n=2 Tax=Coccidioides posadasii TaxID=199306 RepID=E9D8C1_COCPS|nr:conserved hypothetical protein [Coccidioides posadasii str. Silveira]KMM70727.1 hypothetical protein CPAG_07038 [Coccidioides posadasii RMSCC 3488]QVM05602.1 hypothetical protein D8B26_000309 [Coccidioides posadasii str. Silveira]